MILLISHTSNLHGAEHSLFDLVTGLKQRNLPFVVMCPRWGDLPQLLQEYDIPITTFYLPRPQRYPIKLIEFLACWPIAVLRLRSWLVEHGITLVYNNTVDGLYGPFAARLAGIPCVWHVREVKPKQSQIRLIFAWLLKWVPTMAVFNSLATQRAYAEQIPHHWHMVYNGIALPDIDTPSIPTNTLPVVVGYAGQLVSLKRPDRFVQALALARQSMPHLRGVVAGSGVLLEETKRLAKEAGVATNIDFLGHIDKMDSFYREIDILVLTSDHESFGRVLIEAMAAGKPVIAAAVDGVAEVVDDEISGYLVAATNIEAYAERIVYLASDAQQRQKMGKNGRARVIETFSLEVYQETLITLLQKAEATSPRSSFVQSM